MSKKIQVDVKGEYSSNNVTLKRAHGQQQYCFAQNGLAYNQYGRWIYINGELMYEEARSDSNYYGGSTSSYHLSDPYGVEDYDDPDDFADEWAEEFGDGSYDDGYEDAYDYWESERN